MAPNAEDKKASLAGPREDDLDVDTPAAGVGYTKLVNTDLTATRREYLFKPPQFLDSFFLSLLRDPRDLPMIYLLFNITVIVIPGVIACYLLSPPWYVMIGFSFAYWFTFVQRFILCLHFSEHRRIFKDNVWYLNHYAPDFLTFFFGIPPGMYYLHHVVMHHQENNVFPYDVSSTMPYQRDSFLHFLHYWFTFLTATWFQLPYYAYSRKRYGLMVKSLICTTSLFVLCYVLHMNNPTFFWCCSFFTFFATSFALMFGNWSQHIFIDPADPFDSYKLTYNCMNHFENQFTFNDGYHIVHHVNSVCHWTDLPNAFMKKIPTYVERDALVFQDTHFFEVGLLVFTGMLRKLARKYVHLTEKPIRSEEQVMQMLKERLVPIHCEPGKPKKN
eukprot:comp19356_c0_seq1/m.22297 comp19356_c0_seq1/g.22297  ORF comp19356_c0_seq1/g.22297 comp19356_c0_seq1/m.22297 type:complete len:387 (-) comp19356_c0_seq1:61-1221(-)